MTAWTQRPEDEHRLLSSLLACFLAHDAVPRELLTGRWRTSALPVPLTVRCRRRRTARSPTSGRRSAAS